MKCVHCPKCGRALTAKPVGDEGPVPFCEACHLHFFDVAKPCVIVLAMNDREEVVMLRQPYVSTTHWVLIAGLNIAGETAEETVVRKVREETGLSVTDCRYVGSYYHARSDGLMLGFLARVEGGLTASSREVAEVKWTPFGDVPGLLREGSIGLQHYQNVKALLRGRSA